VEFEDGELELGVHDDTVEPSVHRDHDDVIFLVKRQAKTTVPSDPAFGFLGAAGAPVWILPEIENPDLLWAGIATEEIADGVFQDDTVNLRVQKVIGSGQVALYTENAVGLPNVLADSGDGLPDTIALTAGNHLHLNWAFDRAAEYRGTVKATGTLADTGASVSSEPVHLRFVVLP
jgi:surface-anchored protein